MAKKTAKNTYSIHPGEILAEEFLKPLEITQYRLAKSTGVPPRRINEIVQGTRAVTADTALRLGRFFGTTAQFWMNLQTRHDLAVSERALAALLGRVVTPLSEVR
ncbi:addiction module antidote protein, HigA family [Candidatus Kaiserbacteria bacterium RIFCSPLOWO2_01_FULL_53_17]|uniref:Addiction module antidote protein, HigA family n=1 Tax=Candidatus Kaiserbacteria bacterium RIFCSPLOWO2_01_FULL_53_17 TaxID=1798511 RepID=A0A1F6EHR4_9BACT|nr:MAG: addiction module antidote protein, HigA family [Candidatus Kaiserbacteria bacterium RIFCSPLOWO2_01_FULL_53_17]